MQSLTEGTGKLCKKNFIYHAHSAIAPFKLAKFAKNVKKIFYEP
jgi:hypothetical protein